MTEQKKAIWPGWETIRRIGKGGFGAVYEIQRDVLGETEKAALKVITIPRDDSELDEFYSNYYNHDSIADTFRSHLKSILAEYSLMRKMNGTANIVSCDDVHYIQHDDGIGWDIYIKMELLTPLTRSLPLEIPEQTVVKVARDMCAALELCRKHEIVHRDIKPQNIFLSPNGDYKLGDFGIARTMEKTMGGTKIGTFAYMAPEVYNNQPYGTTADIYSLGLVLYWMLNERRLPFLPLPPAVSTVEDNETARLRRFAGEAIPAPRWGSKALKRIVLKACAFDPKDRYQAAQEMLEDLDRLGKPAGTEEGEHTAVLFGGKNKGQSGKGNEETVYLFNNSDKGKTTQPPKKQPIDPQPKKAGNSPEAADKKEPKKKKTGLIAAIVCLVILAVLAAALAVCYFTVHSWSTATCTEPAECKICGKIREAAPGHQWMDATCQTPKTCEVCEETKGEPAPHQWQDATCTDPRICSACKETEGEPLGHQWREATCTLPQTCALCAEQAGEPNGHTWADATFHVPQTCALCGDTEGTPIPYDTMSVEDQVLIIRERYNQIVADRDAGRYEKVTLRQGVTAYYESSGMPACIIVYQGTDGIGSDSSEYSRSYYFSDGKLIFAFYDGTDAHRLYFYNELLMRWRYRPIDYSSANAVNYDFAFTEDYLKWEQLALSEVSTFQ